MQVGPGNREATLIGAIGTGRDASGTRRHKTYEYLRGNQRKRFWPHPRVHEVTVRRDRRNHGSAAVPVAALMLDRDHWSRLWAAA